MKCMEFRLIEFVEAREYIKKAYSKQHEPEFF